jgi:rSAM/selenodomain-associated transferase 1
MKDSAVVVMAKEPLPGQVKTRLCPPLSYEQAAALYQATCQDVIEHALSITSVQTVIAATPASSVDFFQSLAPAAQIIPVEAETIGGCLLHVTTELLNRGFARVAAVSSDSPDLWPDLMQSALDLLESYDLVLGPARDGGYYLIGLNSPQPELFSDSIAWSTHKVLMQTLDIASELDLSNAFLPSSVTDLDRAEDLLPLKRSIEAAPPDAARWTRKVLKTLEAEGAI